MLDAVRWIRLYAEPFDSNMKLQLQLLLGLTRIEVPAFEWTTEAGVLSTEKDCIGELRKIVGDDVLVIAVD